eukprot:NODE_2839_length_1479_cov_62.489676_g2201_i1.p1 GENE.NODE_2839_length_1479_cov_62.489676_g2201_i1~~NODE_2839_length_1479_cov_62.489676_g2201_i1.p1  ORF type:complete len:244 (+),score=34.45 NODE_2839_length_1479_cov_62.489676_g2201_i1:340-1071(+)
MSPDQIKCHLYHLANLSLSFSDKSRSVPLLAAVLQLCGWNVHVLNLSDPSMCPHQFLLVVPPLNKDDNKNRYVLDVDFKDMFDIVRPTREYSTYFHKLSPIFVGSTTELYNVILLLCARARISLTQNKLPSPPWRTPSVISNAYQKAMKGIKSTLSSSTSLIPEIKELATKFFMEHRSRMETLGFIPTNRQHYGNIMNGIQNDNEYFVSSPAIKSNQTGLSNLSKLLLNCNQDGLFSRMGVIL